MSLTPEDKRRRLAAKRNNERVKLAATSLNALALALLGAAFLIPALSNAAVLLTVEPWFLLFVAVALHFGAQATLNLLQSED